MTLEQAMPGRPGGLVRRLSADELDWDAIYADQLPRIYAYFKYRLGSGVDVEDLTSRTFEKAWRARDRYRSDLAGFSTWLVKIAQNICIDYLRSHRNHLPIDVALDIAGEATPYKDIERISDKARLVALIVGLPERERELIALKYGAGINNVSIARLTGLSESNVGTILHRAVETLRSKW
jgi:RNA polymerase sigma-70 factor, ECF subfamily